MKASDLPLHYNMCEILEHNLETRADKTAILTDDGSMTLWRLCCDFVSRQGRVGYLVFCCRQSRCNRTGYEYTT